MLHITKEPSRPIFQEVYENLACAVVHKAVDDYRQAMRRADKALSDYKKAETISDPEKSRRALQSATSRMIDSGKMIANCEMFFRSSWFSVLAGDSIHGDAVIRKLRADHEARR